MDETPKLDDLAQLGSTWDRRRFLAGLFSAGAAATCAVSFGQVGAPELVEEHDEIELGSGPPQNGSPPSPLEQCKDSCYDSYLFCCQGCKRHRNRVRRALCYSACFTPYVACLTACEAEWALSVAGEAIDWLAEHPEVVVGTIVVVAGVTMIVATGGSGALVLVPAL